MNNVTKTGLALLTLLLANVANAAPGTLSSPLALKPAEREALRARVATARAASPKAFEALAGVRDGIAGADARKRGRLAPVSPALKSLGAEGLLPMLELLAFGAPRAAQLTVLQRRALSVGLLEAVGGLRDPRAAPVIRAVLTGEESDFSIVRAAAEALGRLGDDASAATLAAMARAEGPKRSAVLAGMGDCRRLVAVRALAEALSSAPDEETARLAARSLGEAGSSWAWQTPGAGPKAERDAIRETCARALVEAFARRDGEARQAAANALLVVDWPQTGGLIEQAKRGALPETAAALEGLEARFLRNPAR